MPTLTPNTRLEDRYTIVKLIGDGGAGEVYRATDEHTGGTVAIKLISKQRFSERAQREIEIMQSLPAHPNLMRILGNGHHDGQRFVVMEYIKGEDLFDVMQKSPLSAPRIKSIVLSIAEALRATHAAGVIHRDIKPENIRVLPDDISVKVMDFGLARRVSDKLTTKLAGSWGYTAPEVWKGKPDPASDIYALGCVFYAMVVGQPPFVSDDAPALMAMHLNQSPDLNALQTRQLDPVLCDLVKRMLAKLPEDRPTAQQIINELSPRALYRREKTEIFETAPIAQRKKSDWLALTLIIGGILGVLGVGGLLINRGNETVQPSPTLKEVRAIGNTPAVSIILPTSTPAISVIKTVTSTLTLVSTPVPTKTVPQTPTATPKLDTNLGTTININLAKYKGIFANKSMLGPAVLEMTSEEELPKAQQIVNLKQQITALSPAEMINGEWVQFVSVKLWCLKQAEKNAFCATDQTGARVEIKQLSYARITPNFWSNANMAGYLPKGNIYAIAESDEALPNWIMIQIRGYVPVVKP